MSAHSQPRITPEEYLEKDRAAEFRSEYYDGYMYAMSGGSWAHAVLIGNLTGTLFAALKGRPCSVTPNDMRLQVMPSGMYAYPDVMVLSGEPAFADGRKDVVTNSSLIVEVLSPSTEAYDRGFKSSQYRSLPSLREYAFLWQNEPHLEIYRRKSPTEWLLIESVGNALCDFQSVGCQIPLGEIYSRIVFEPATAPPRDVR